MAEAKADGLKGLIRLILSVFTGSLAADVRVSGVKLSVVLGLKSNNTKHRRSSSHSSGKPRQIKPIKLPWWLQNVVSGLTVAVRDVVCRVEVRFDWGCWGVAHNSLCKTTCAVYESGV